MLCIWSWGLSLWGDLSFGAGQEKCSMCPMCAPMAAVPGPSQGGVGGVTELTQQLRAHLLIFACRIAQVPSANGTRILPFPKFDWYWSMDGVQNECDFCRGEVMLLIVPHISILFRNPIIAANQTRKVSLFLEWCYLFICQSALHFLRSQTSPCLAVLILWELGKSKV